MGFVKGKGGKWTIEAVAQLMLQRSRQAKGYIDPSQFLVTEQDLREKRNGPRWQPTLKRVNFLERDYPEWWHDPEFFGQLRPGSRRQRRQV
jgi:hypothetical protein